MVEFETVTAKEVKFGKNNFIEVAKKKAVSDTEEREFISISRGYYLPDGSKRWKSSITLPDEKEKREQIGKLLKDLARSHQVICITHLQQIASVAQRHFVVKKKTVQKRTITLVKKLEDTERINEIARMISGDSRSQSSLEFAKKLLSESGNK